MLKEGILFLNTSFPEEKNEIRIVTLATFICTFLIFQISVHHLKISLEESFWNLVLGILNIFEIIRGSYGCFLVKRFDD